MKKILIALIVATYTSIPSLFAFHAQPTDHLISGKPVMFIVTGPKFSTESHDAISTAIGKWFSSA